MDGDPREGHPIARGSDAHQFALVGTLRRPTANNLLPFSYRVLERYAQVGEGGTDHGEELLQTLDADDIFVGFVQDYVLRVHLLEGILEGIQASLSPDLPGAASERLVLFGHSLSSFPPARKKLRRAIFCPPPY